MRVIKLDHDTVALLTAHKQHAETWCAALGTTLDEDAFVFSYAPDHRRHCDPDGITHRYAKMTADLGIDTHLHALRHYSATELLAGGVDLRTVAGRRPRRRRSNHTQGLRRLGRRSRHQSRRPHRLPSPPPTPST
jgi:hypothetical protein